MNNDTLEIDIEAAGPQGLSAYEVALQNGFVGTEQEWLDSLKAEISEDEFKTINGESILGQGNIEGGSGTSTDVQINGSSITSSGTANIVTEGVYNASTNKIATMSDMPDITGKQDTLVSGNNIKTINNQSILGSGNINISGGEAISVGNIQFDLVEESE